MTPPMGRVPITAPLRHAPFRMLVAGRSLMYFGNGFATAALAFAVLDATGSVLHLGLVVGARSLASVVLLLFGGVLADRVPRPLILRGACALAALSQAALAAAILLGVASLPIMIVLSLINGAAAAANLPASAALTPQTVPQTLLRQANGLAAVSKQIGTVSGLPLGGLVVGLVGPGWAIGVDAMMFALAGVFFTYLRLPAEPVATGERQHPLRDLLDGWSEFVSRRWVWVIALQFMVCNACRSGAIAVLGPAIADDSFGRAAWGMVLAANVAGMLVGGLLAASWQPRRALVYGVALIALTPAPMLALSVAPTVPILLVTMFISGIAVEQFGVAWEVAIQENVPPDRLARVYSYDALGSFIAMPLGEVAVGPLSNWLGTGNALFVLAALILAATAAAVSSRSLRSVTRS